MQTFTGRQYLQIDIANSFGHDKKSWQDRLSWFEQNAHQLHALLNQAEEPALFYAGVRAWESVERGEPIGYPVSLDATASGLQILACLTSDKKAASLCNVVNTGKREDAYTSVYEGMLEVMGEDSKIQRSDIKGAVMKSFYGSERAPKEVFGEGRQLQIFYDVMEEKSPGPWELNAFLLEAWDAKAESHDWVLPDNFHVHVKVETTITDRVHFLNEPIDITRKIQGPKQKGRSLSANMVHSIDGFFVREITRRCDYDRTKIDNLKLMLAGELEYLIEDKREKAEATEMVDILWRLYQRSGFLSARILDYLDSDTICFVRKSVIQELVNSLPSKPFKIITTHDCFRCLPHYMNDLRKQYILQLHYLARSEMLSFLLSQILQRDLHIGKLDESLAQDILSAEYPLS